jgi:gluconate 2-dehydrogenase gamma chain
MSTSSTDTAATARMTPHIRRVVSAAAERILPGDEWPGATEAHVIGYIEWLSTQPRLDERWTLLTRAVDLIESLATAIAGVQFAECGAAEQDAVLDRLQSIPHVTAQRAFALLVNLTITGYFCNPAYGGNHEGVVWRHLAAGRSWATSNTIS